MQRYLAILFLIMACSQCAPRPAQAEEEKRQCWGLVWCKEEKDGSVSTDYFFGLYSSEQKGSYSRLAVRLFYSTEADPEKEYLGTNHDGSPM